MRLAHLALLASIAVLAAACSGAGATATPASVAPASVAPASVARATAAPASVAPAEPASTSAAATRIDVTLSDSLKIEPAAMTVPAGQPVTFVVTNAGTGLHEFVLGDEAEQAEHEQEMVDQGGMSMPKDEDMAIGVEPGKTKELTVTFDAPGSILAGCHVVSHYAAGMKATITIE